MTPTPGDDGTLFDAAEVAGVYVFAAIRDEQGCHEYALSVVTRSGVDPLEGRRIGFERRVFAGVPQTAEILALPPSARRLLLEEGIPAYFYYRGYSADPGLSVVHWDGRSPLVRFGKDSRGIIGIEVGSGNVIHFSDKWGTRVTFINETLGQFTETALLLAGKFPYGVTGDWLEGAVSAAAMMRQIIRSVDAGAAVLGRYWPDFVDEIDGWMYSLGDILSWYQRKQAQLSSPDSGSSRLGAIPGTDGRLF